MLPSTLADHSMLCLLLLSPTRCSVIMHLYRSASSSSRVSYPTLSAPTPFEQRQKGEIYGKYNRSLEAEVVTIWCNLAEQYENFQRQQAARHRDRVDRHDEMVKEEPRSPMQSGVGSFEPENRTEDEVEKVIAVSFNMLLGNLFNAA